MGRVAVLMAAIALLAGCGQKGPLYLPDKGGEVVTRPGGGQQPPADEKKKERDFRSGRKQATCFEPLPRSEPQQERRYHRNADRVADQ